MENKTSSKFWQHIYAISQPFYSSVLTLLLLTTLSSLSHVLAQTISIQPIATEPTEIISKQTELEAISKKANDPEPEVVHTQTNDPVLEVIHSQANDSVLEVIHNQANDPELEVVPTQTNDPVLEVIHSQANDPELEVVPTQTNDPELEVIHNQTSQFDLCQKAIRAGYLNYGEYLLNPKDFQVLELQTIVQPYLTRLQQALDTQGTQLFTMVLPPRSMVFPELSPSTSKSYNQLVNNLQEAGLETIAIDSVFERTKADFFFYYDHHWTPYAASEIAKEVAAVLDLDDEAKQQFNSSPIAYNWSPYNSRLKNLSELCGREYASREGEYLYSWITTMSASEGLFDTRLEAFAKPSILLGTSNSESSTLNFAGFLSEHTGQNIANYAFSSSGALGSMFYYFLSEEYQNARPRYIFWELLANPHTTNFNLNAIKYYRQIIPSIYGGCRNTAITTSSFNLNEDSQRTYLPLFAEDSNLTPNLASATSSDFYLSFDLSGDALDRIIVEIQYSDGRIDQSSLELLPSTRGYQKAYLEFLDNITGSNIPSNSRQILSAHLTFPAGSGLKGYTNIDVDLCKKN